MNNNADWVHVKRRSIYEMDKFWTQRLISVFYDKQQLYK